MSRARFRAAVLLAAALGFASLADAKPGKPVAPPHEVIAKPATPADPRTQLGDQLAAQADTLHKTEITVGDKLHVADDVRAHRLRAAIRVLNGELPDGATPEERMAAARRRAAARLLLERDASERELLATETRHLHDAERVIAAASHALPSITLPTALLVPAQGRITRRFGEYVHAGSQATLSRRGIDFDVEDRAPAIAPAAGVVRYAGPLRGLDHGVILDHGDYFTVIGKLGELTLPLGTRVNAGDRVGRAAHHRVYLEVRVKVGPGGLPIDPEPLFVH